MSRHDGDQSHTLPSSIRRQIGAAANMRYLRSLPAFRVDPKLPADMLEMLEEMERAENSPRSRR
jgi:hypothetical protein